MSKIIENDHLWDESEVAYKEARNLHDEVEQNKRDWAGVEVAGTPDSGETKTVELELDPKVFEFVKGLDPEQLKEALVAREMETTGSTKELKMALAQRIQADKNAAHSE